MAYEWALNKEKLARAFARAGSRASEEKVKGHYIAIGGKVALEVVNDTKMDEKEEELVVETPSVVAEEATPEVEVIPEVPIENVPSSTDDVAAV
jgi:hypothetical protein